MTELDQPHRAGATGRLRPAGAAAVPLVLFVALLLLVQHRWGPLRRLDTGVVAALHRVAVAHHPFVLAMQGVSTLGTSVVYVVVFGRLLIWLIWRRRRRAAAFTVVATVGGTALNGVLKSIVQRARPVFVDPVSHAAHSSFPSGHAQGVAVAAGVLLLLLLPSLRPRRRRLVVCAAVCWAVLMAFSRVALGVHYPSDVVAGLAVGAAWVLLCAAAFRPSGVYDNPGRPGGRQRAIPQRQ